MPRRLRDDAGVARSLPPGLYETPVTYAVAAELERLEPSLRAELEALAADALPETLARLLHRRLRHALAAIDGKHAARDRVRLANAVVDLLREHAPRGGAEAGDRLPDDPEQLLAIVDASAALAEARAPERPGIPLSTSDLLVNGRHDRSIGSEVRRELASADRVELLCSFLKWSGYRLVEPALRAFVARRPQGLRVLTTAYMGATERRVLDALAELGAEVRVSYDTSRTRLHAKAWLFHRDSGFATACIGSSNLSHAAMLDGLEWNVRLSQIDNGPILHKFLATFEQYWADPEFVPYDPARDARRYDDAVRRQLAARNELLTAFDIEPRPHQQEMLDDLAAERQRGHRRNLVVAATGTGKTIVAALDYRRLRKALGGHASLLFVAHRHEILAQSHTTFQMILKDGAFGERLVGGDTPRRGEHVFASVQSLHADRLADLPSDAFDVVIVDEFHHAAAPTYDRLLQRLAPKYLVGLTATPERADGKSILHWFDGRIASELRLWKALDQGLLAPFQYFGVEGPDVAHVRWSGGHYDTKQLSNVYTADHFFAKRILREVHDKIVDPTRMRALGFCVDIAHAEFMAARFCEAGLAARAVSQKTGRDARRAALQGLRDGSLRAIFSVDLFNEGVDLPDVDTVLFLRPTESVTVFIQQLGRGLRRSPDKACLTVLDFIGFAHARFRFDRRFRAIVGGTRRQIAREVEEGFPSLPSGCAIRLDPHAQRAVLDNLRHAIGAGSKGLVEDILAMARDGRDITLPALLDAGIELDDIYAKDRCLTLLRRQAGLDPAPPGPEDHRIARALSRLLHIDDHERLDALRAFVAAPRPPRADAGDPSQRQLFVLLGFMREPYGRLRHAWQALWTSPLRAELAALLDVLDDRSRRLSFDLPALPGLRTHGTYSLDEIMATVDERTSKGGVKRIQTGVYYLPRRRTDLLFVTLEKNEAQYTPTTLYDDYPITPSRFHWESQSNCHEATKTGARYLRIRQGADDKAVLFVRQRRKDDRGVTMPYLCLGLCFYERHEGARPMAIEWSLAHPMPAGWYQETKLAAG